MSEYVKDQDKLASGNISWLLVFPLVMTMLLAGLLYSSDAEAYCRVGPDHKNRGGDGYSSGMGISAINIMSDYLQPMHSIIASSTVVPHQSFAGYQAGSPDDVLYYCDTKAEADQILLTVATNGDFAGAGQHEVPEYPGAYYTGWKNVASKVTVVDTGMVVKKHYQQVPLEPIYNAELDRYEVRFGQLPALRLELVKVSTVPPTGYVADNDNDPYPWSQPFVYYVFTMPNVNPNGPQPGENSQYEFTGWSAHFVGFGIHRNPRAIMYRRSGCIVTNNTPFVLFPTVSVQEMESGASIESPVRVEVECDDGVVSGTGGGHTAFGLQVSPEAYSAAKAMPGLVNSYGGVSHLLPDGYGVDPGVAKGVGIRLEHGAARTSVPFIGWHGVNCTSADPEVCGENPTGGGWQAGWIPVLEGADMVTETEMQTSRYTQSLMAILEKIPNTTVTPGKIKARAQVLVRVQ